MGKHRQEKLCSKILITVAAVLLLAYTGVAWYMQHLFSYGTRINTVNASFLTVEEVKERLLEGLSGYTLTIQAKDGEEAVISGEEIAGHEFHRWACTQPGDACRAVRPSGGDPRPCMICEGKLLAGFPHLYFPSNPRFAARFAAACVQYQKETTL